jgi:hypothetical protein
MILSFAFVVKFHGTSRARGASTKLCLVAPQFFSMRRSIRATLEFRATGSTCCRKIRRKRHMLR